jgi:predicted MPP superfamily phosphohydrolase
MLRLFAGAFTGLAAWSLWEAQWVELNDLEVRIEGLPPELDGFTILHLSDFHLGTASLNGRTLERAIAWAEEDGIDLVALTGDLLSRQRGEKRLRGALERLRPPHGVFAVLGNHDVDVSRDPFNEVTDLAVLEEHGAVLLEDDAVDVAVGERRVQVVGCDPRDWKERRLERLADPSADLRVLLVHFPDAVDRLAPGVFDLVLAGHLHGGQICVPLPGRKIRLEHLRARYWEGLHHTPAGWLHVSRGLGTSFVPFRLLARPEATKLVLRSAH